MPETAAFFYTIGEKCGLAVCVARLLILREDFFIELSGLRDEELKDLDANSRIYRQIYFFRNSVRTLFEIEDTIDSLRGQREFKQMLAMEAEAKRNDFQKLVENLNSAHRVVKDIRHAIGGHVSEDQVRNALYEMTFDQEALLKLGRKHGESHYEFVGEILEGILGEGGLKSQKREKLENNVKTFASLLSVMLRIDDIFAMYVKNRRLMN